MQREPHLSHETLQQALNRIDGPHLKVEAAWLSPAGRRTLEERFGPAKLGDGVSLYGFPVHTSRQIPDTLMLVEYSHRRSSRYKLIPIPSPRA